MFNRFCWPWAGGSTDQPELEVRSLAPRRPEDIGTPLLFVHGAYAAAWCWERFFMPYFADLGYTVHALSFRGHGGSGGVLHESGIEDYVRDLAHVAAALPSPPVLVGHSMGGLVVQRYLEDHPAEAVVLMASVPPSGLMQSTMRLMMGDPMLFVQMGFMQVLGVASMDTEVTRRAVFSNRLSDEELREYGSSMQVESQRALWEMTATVLPRPWRIDPPPMLVLGAANDALFTADEARRTAGAYGADCHVEPDMAHAMMLEPGWRAVAARIDDWLRRSGVS